MTESNIKLFQALEHGITRIDTGLGGPGVAACYLMESNDGTAIIETGTPHTVPDIIALLSQKDIALSDVRFVIATHVHLDHAGGVGKLMELLPNARLLIHPRGARHMIDPSKLQAGAMAVYGEKKYMEQYGDLLPVPADRVDAMEDGQTITLGDRKLTFYDTPGHAKHHFCVHDSQSNGIFTGDTLGVVYKQLCHGKDNFVMPTTTPVQFDPQAMCDSIDRLFALKPDTFYLTHYGQVLATQQHIDALKKHINNYVAIAESENPDQVDEGRLYQKVLEYTLRELESYGSPLNREEQINTIQGDITLNVQGLIVWLKNKSNKH